MKRFILPLLAVAVWPGAAGASPAVREATLPNGLRVLLAPDSLAPGVDVAVWYRAGVRWEPARGSGLTHLLERLMFEGSANVGDGEHARRVRGEGGACNVTSGPDFSCFWQTLPPSGLGLALRLEADRMASLRITAASLARAKREAREDVRRAAEHSALGRALSSLYAAAYPGHPYARPLRGLDAERDAVTLAAARAWWTERYGPDGALLTVTGRFDPDSALALARRTVGAVARRTAPPARPLPPPQAEGETRVTLRAETPTPLLVLGWRAPAGGDTARVALRALARLYAGGPASRLMRGLQRPETPFLLASDGTASLRREGSLLYAVTLVRPGADTSAVEGAAFVEANRLAAEAPDAEDLERARAEVELELRAELETARGRAAQLGTAHFVAGDWREAERDLARITRLTAEDVRAMAARVFRPENAVVVWVHPSATVAQGGAR